MSGFDCLDSTEIFESITERWRLVDKLPMPMYGLRASTIDGRVLIFGKIWTLILFGGALISTLGGSCHGEFDTILEYSVTEEIFIHLSGMLTGRHYHAISIVPFDDFSTWCL